MSMKVVWGGSARARAAARGSSHGGEGGVDLAHVQRQAAHGPVALQGHPVLGGPGGLVDLIGRAVANLGREPAQPQRPGHLQAGADDRVADHHHRHRGARDDVEIVGRATRGRLLDQAHVAISGHHLADLPLGDADQHDGFGMFDQVHAQHAGVVVQRDQGVDRACRNSRSCPRNRRSRRPSRCARRRAGSGRQAGPGAGGRKRRRPRPGRRARPGAGSGRERPRPAPWAQGRRPAAAPAEGVSRRPRRGGRPRGESGRKSCRDLWFARGRAAGDGRDPRAGPAGRGGRGP